MTQLKKYTEYSEFYNHPTIKKLEKNKRWTVSSENKMPLDMINLIEHNKVTGALYRDERSLVDLKTLCNTIPYSDNVAYFLDVLEDDIIILDIEPNCPPEIRKELETIPALYIEESMSGKGLHLICKKPKNFDEYPIAAEKSKIQEENKYYEILLSHYITFTRRQVHIKADPNKSIEKLFARMAKTQKSIKTEQIDVSELKPEIPNEDELIETLYRMEYDKELSDFNNNNSSYEYGYFSYFLIKLERILSSKIYSEIEIDDNQKAWLLYLTISEKIDYRSKHDETRQGLPWLLYLAKTVVARID